MLRVLLYITMIAGIISCQKERVIKPVLTGLSDTLYVPFEEIVFMTDEAEWEAVLYTASQPAELTGNHAEGKLHLQLKLENGMTEGPSHILLSKGETYFEYPVYVKNITEIEINQIDYRSSKSIHVDYGLSQQRIIHKIDQYRNLHLINGGKYFFSDRIIVPPRAGIYRADPNKPLSSFYVQPGQSTQINLIYKYLKQKNVFEVSAKGLKDQYGNTVSDGTIITFIYLLNEKMYSQEKAVLDGASKINLPYFPTERIQVYARINDTFSRTIKLEKL